MKVSEAVYRSFIDKDFLTGQDERGYYVHYDRIVIPLNGHIATFWLGKNEVGSLPFTTPLKRDDIVTINGIVGRVRLILG